MVSLSGIFQSLYTKLNAPGLKKKTNFFRLLALSQKSWIGIRDALISILKTERHKGLFVIINDIIEQVNQWLSFSLSLKNHRPFFKEEEIALIQSAEAIWNLPDILEEISLDLEDDERINQRIKKASTYPIILLLFSAVAVVVLLIYVIPMIVWMFPDGNNLPSITVFMLKLSNFVQKYWMFIFIIVISLFFWFKFLYKRVLSFKILVDKLLIVVPIVSDVVKTFYMYRYSKLLSQLYIWGISPVVSLRFISNAFTNFHYKKKVMEIQNDIKSWFWIAESMEWSSLFDPILIQIISIWENTWDMWWVLKKIASFYRELLQNKIDILLSMIEPIFMLFVAVIIWLIVWSVFLPMADMVNNIQ